MRIYVTEQHATHDLDGVRLEATVEFWPEHTNDIYEYEKLMRDCGVNSFCLDYFRKLFNIKPRESTLPSIKNVYFNPPATVVLWDDGTKTVVKCQDGDTYSNETGLALCMAKKAMGNSSRQFNDIFHKWIPEEKTESKKETVVPRSCRTCRYFGFSYDVDPCCHCVSCRSNWAPAK